ncbi:MAG: hypothetical protein PHT19_14800, partial [Methylococcus sp.]|nr:hypothetical protein [Methylococcus sp.]
RLTASSLNSAVYSCFGIFFIVFLSMCNSILRYPWKTIFRGKVILDDNLIARPSSRRAICCAFNRLLKRQVRSLAQNPPQMPEYPP